jgi:murein DD-endopeptidase MepM/ murein hydrolase activator NlpD
LVLPKPRLRAFILALFAVALAIPASAQAQAGGAAFPGAPSISSARCATGEDWTCVPGERLRVRGSDLQSITSVAFVGGRGGRDDRFARARRVTASSFLVVVPRDARSGPLRVRGVGVVARSSSTLTVPSARLKAEPQSPAAAPQDGGEAGMVFPIQGRHDMGQSQTNNFGGGRGHGGQDMFAACGTTLVAVTSGTVQHTAYHSAAGYYLVLQDRSGRSYAYMHLRRAAELKEGDSVRVGQEVGEVGDTGRATGCHLHFELWTAPGWYSGGKAIDPLPLLRRLEAAPHSHR